MSRPTKGRSARRRISGLEQQALPAVADHLRHSPGGGRHDDSAAAHGLNAGVGKVVHGRRDGHDIRGGAEYRRYGDAAVEMVEARGGKVIWSGRADQILIGDPEQDWDVVVLVQYPSRQAFVDMVTTDEYNEAHTHREGGLERTIVVACTPRTGAVS